MSRHLLKALLAATVALAAPHSASATTIAASSIDAMAETADEIVVGEVVSVEPVMQDGRVWTRVTLATEACYVNEPVALIEITVPGGRTGTYATRVAGAGDYEVGERVLVFLEDLGGGHWGSQALAFSKFRVEEVEGRVLAVRELAGLRLVLPDPAAVIPPDIERSVFEFAELEAWIIDAGMRR